MRMGNLICAAVTASSSCLHSSRLCALPSCPGPSASPCSTGGGPPKVRPHSLLRVLLLPHPACPSALRPLRPSLHLPPTPPCTQPSGPAVFSFWSITQGFSSDMGATGLGVIPEQWESVWPSSTEGFFYCHKCSVASWYASALRLLETLNTGVIF